MIGLPPKSIRLQADLLSKTYMAPAMDLSDSIVISDHRVDKKQSYHANLSYPIDLGAGSMLRPIVEYAYFKNESNDPYHQYEKYTITFGLEYNF